jgi:hypothetical protein
MFNFFNYFVLSKNLKIFLGVRMVRQAHHEREIYKIACKHNAYYTSDSYETIPNLRAGRRSLGVVEPAYAFVKTSAHRSAGVQDDKKYKINIQNKSVWIHIKK